MSNTLSGASKAVSYIPTAFKVNATVEGVKAINENAGNLLAGLFDIVLADPESQQLDNPFSPRTAMMACRRKPIRIYRC
jgi:hypothetical protein